jgi:hypothetical protein
MQITLSNWTHVDILRFIRPHSTPKNQSPSISSSPALPLPPATQSHMGKPVLLYLAPASEWESTRQNLNQMLSAKEFHIEEFDPILQVYDQTSGQDIKAFIEHWLNWLRQHPNEMKTLWFQLSSCVRHHSFGTDDHFSICY